MGGYRKQRLDAEARLPANARPADELYRMYQRLRGQVRSHNVCGVRKTPVRRITCGSALAREWTTGRRTVSDVPTPSRKGPLPQFCGARATRLTAKPVGARLPANGRPVDEMYRMYQRLRGQVRSHNFCGIRKTPFAAKPVGARLPANGRPADRNASDVPTPSRTGPLPPFLRHTQNPGRRITCGSGPVREGGIRISTHSRQKKTAERTAKASCGKNVFVLTHQKIRRCSAPSGRRSGRPGQSRQRSLCPDRQCRRPCHVPAW